MSAAVPVKTLDEAGIGDAPDVMDVP